MKKLALVIAIVLAATPALAQSRPLPRVSVVQAQQNPFSLLQHFTEADLQAALSDANAQTPPDHVAAACYTALLGLVQHGNTPFGLPSGAFSAFQKARDIKAMIANLQSPNGPLSSLNVACAPLLIDAQATLLQLGLVAGFVVK